jgi:hypothetical protein
LLLVSLIIAMCVPRTVLAHCDTMDGPVVVAAKAALQEGDVTPVLKWVKSTSMPTWTSFTSWSGCRRI